MFKYVLEIEYNWQQYGRSGTGKPVPVTVYANSQDEALQKALDQSGSKGFKSGGWKMHDVLSVEELPDMIDPAEVERLQELVDSLSDDYGSLAEALNKAHEFPDVTRVVVVPSEGGVVLDKRDVFDHGVYLQVQDGGRTLKLFPMKAVEVPF